VIQRTLKILDVRLQHVQSNCKSEEQTREDIQHIRTQSSTSEQSDEGGHPAHQNSQTREDIQHIRTVMSENHKALSSVVSVLSSLQDEVSTAYEKPCSFEFKLF